MQYVPCENGAQGHPPDAPAILVVAFTTGSHKFCDGTPVAVEVVYSSPPGTSLSCANTCYKVTRTWSYPGAKDLKQVTVGVA